MYYRKKSGRNETSEPKDKLFDLRQVMEFKSTRRAMEIEKINVLFKKIEEAFLKGHYNSFGNSKVGKISPKIDTLVRMGYIDPEAYQRKLENGRDVITNKKKKSALKIFKNFNIK